MKRVLLLVQMLFCVTIIFAQEPEPVDLFNHLPIDTNFQYFGPTDAPILCRAENIASVSELNLKSGMSYFLVRFSESVPAWYRVTDTNGRSLAAKVTDDQSILIQKRATKQIVKFHQLNSCGEDVYATIGETVELSGNDRIIEISAELMSLLSRFKNSELNLANFLAADNSVSELEKLAFYQMYALDGRPMHLDTDKLNNDDIKSLWPYINEQFAPTFNCKCDVLRLSTNHGIGTETGQNFPWNKSYIPKHVNGNEAKINCKTETYYWQVGRVLGAARWQSMHTEGYRSPKTEECDKTYEIGLDSTRISSGEITVHLMCMNGEQLPDSCNCSKTGFFSYRYDAEVHARAEHRYAPNFRNWRKSRAHTQDVAFACCYFGADKGNINSFLPVEGIDSRVSATCNDNTNPNFWANTQTLGEAIIAAFADSSGRVYEWRYEFRYDSTFRDSIRIDSTKVPPVRDTLKILVSIDTVVVDSIKHFVDYTSDAEKYKDLLGAIFGVLRTSYLDSTVCNGTTRFTTMDGFLQFTLKPNEPARFIVMSLGKNNASGRRSWYSVSETKSAYNMSVIIRPGRTTGEESACCTPWAGAYLVANPFLSGDDVYRDVAYDLGSLGGFNPGDPNGLLLTSTQVLVRGEAGGMFRPADNAECTVPVEISGANPSTPAFSLNMEQSLQYFGGDVQFFDVLGRNLMQMELPANHANPLQVIAQSAQSNLPMNQIVFVSVKSNGQVFGYKLFNNWK